MSSTVEDWLRSLGLIQYTQAFLDNGYDELDICKEIGEEDLDAIGVRNIKDRVDILSAVLRLKQSGTAVYFVLEEGTQPTAPTQVREKLVPLKLKVLLRDTLKDDSIDLTEPPYTLPNGTCGNLGNLVTLYADKFYTYEEDVLEALENIRERQVGDLKSSHSSKTDEGEGGFDSSPSHKNKHKRSKTTPLAGIAKETSQFHGSHSTLHAKGIPADYLDVDSTSSPHKKVKRRRPVERNSNLSRSLDSLKELHINPSEIKTKDKNQQTSKPKQPSSIFGLFRSSKRKSPGHDDKSYDTKSLNDIHVGKPVAGADLPASYLTMGEEDRVALMLMVKQGELTVEEAVQQLESYEKENKKKQATKKDMRRNGSCSEEDSNIKPVKLKRSIFGRSTKKKSSSRPVSEIAACDMTMSEEDRINLMKGVRDHKITIEEAVQKLLSYEEESPGHKVKVNKHKFSPKSPHSFSRLSIKRVSGAFASGKNAPSKEEKTSVFYTPTEGIANTSSDGCSEEESHWPSDSSPDPSPAGRRKVMHNLLRGAKQIHSTSSLHSSSSSSDAVDRLGTIEDMEDQETPFSKGSRTSPEKRMVSEMKTILSRREQEETSKKIKDSSPIHASTLPRNGKPTQISLSRKSSLPISTAPPAYAVRKPPPPPPRPLPRQSTMPVIVPRASESKTKNEADMATKPKPPKCLPRRKSLGDGSRSTERDTQSKLTDAERSVSSQLPLMPHPPTKPEDTKGAGTLRDSVDFSDLPSPPETLSNSRMSLEDDVFPPLPPEHMLSSLRPVSQVEVYKKVIVKPPRPSLLKHMGDDNASRSPVGTNKTTGALRQRNVKEEAASNEEKKGPTGQTSYPEDSGSNEEAGGTGSPQDIGSPVHTGSPARTGSPAHTGSPVHTGSPKNSGSPVHTGSPKDSESPVHTNSPGQTVSPEQEGSPGLPVTKPKPPVKPKPHLPPKPLKPTPGSASSKIQDEGKKKADSSTQSVESVDQESALSVVQIPHKRPSHSLSDLIERRLRIEQIDLTELPYSTEDGRWDVPINLIDRYTEEMRRSQKEIVEIMDRIRCSKLNQKHRPAIACDVSLYPQQPDNLGKLTSLEDWLISLGLPMYLDNLKEVEYDNMATMPYLKQKHFEYAGVVNLRHMRRLLASVERMPKTILGPS